MMAAYPPGGINGIKLESFIFDVFPAAQHMAILEIERNAEFSPVKNAPGSLDDSPDTARALISTLHKEWLHKAGVQVQGNGLVEISGEASYGGEGLNELKGRTLDTPLLIRKIGEHDAHHHHTREGVNVIDIA